MTVPLKARILLADDHALVRSGLRMVLNLEADFDLVAEAGDGLQAVELALAQPLDLAILDVSMPGLTGPQAARQLREHRPDLRILLLSMHDGEQHLREALAAGASGYVLKSAADRDLVHACRAALRGQPFVYPAEIDAILRAHLEDTSQPGGAGIDRLSARETEIVKLVAEGHSSKTIGTLLHISDKTVERHRANVFDKLGLTDRVALTRYAIRRGLIEP